MDGFFSRLFDTSMMPHGHCYLWNDNLVSLHVISDLLIAIAYFTIPLALIILVRKRDDLHFNYIFLFFALFILACGVTHVIAIYNVWNGAYWLSGLVKAVTAVASIATAILVWPLLPKALAIPSNSNLIDLNERLQKESESNKRLSERLERLIIERELQATHDSLTSLRNRRGFEERWQEEVAVAKRTGEPLLLMMIDLDFFKQVNDLHGHAIGDVVLESISAVMKKTLRTNDIPARFGGEEFVVALPNTGLSEGGVVAERLRAAIENHAIPNDQSLNLAITCSIGLTQHNFDVSLTETLKNVDALLYKAKDAGRNNVCADTE